MPTSVDAAIPFAAKILGVLAAAVLAIILIVKFL